MEHIQFTYHFYKMVFDKGLLQRKQLTVEYTGKMTVQTQQHSDDTWHMYYSYLLHALPQTWNKVVVKLFIT